MKKLLQSTFVRVVCQVLAFAMLATLVPNGLTTKAYAQSGSALGSEPAQKVGVVEFINDSNRFGQIVSKNATDAFIMECNKNDKIFQIEASPEEVKAKMEEMGIRQPTSKLDCINIARELGLDGMVQGYIKSISVKGEGPNKIATANVVIQYVNAYCGEILVGTNAKGESSARIGFTADEDTLVVEAVNKAINNAMYNLSNYSVPKATIHANEGNDHVFLSKGHRDNLYPGLRMVVMRGAYPKQDENLEDSTIVTEMRVVGYIEVETVNSNDATARIIKQNVGVKPEDICYGLYDEVYISKFSPIEESQNSVNTKSTREATKRNTQITNIGYVLLGLAGLVGLASLFSANGEKESGPNIDVSSTPGMLRVRSNTNGYITGKICGLRIYKDNESNYVELLNSEGSYSTFYGAYDGRQSAYVNVFELFPQTLNVQSKYYAKWMWIKPAEEEIDISGGGGSSSNSSVVTGKGISGKPNTDLPPGMEQESGSDVPGGGGESGDEPAAPEVQLSEPSGECYWTYFNNPNNLEPSSTIDFNSFVEGSAFIWNSDAYSSDKVTVQYKVEVWNATNAANKKVFTTNKKYLTTSDLSTLYDYFNTMGTENEEYIWRVGIRNTQDSGNEAFMWTDVIRFTVDSLPPAPPTKGLRRGSVR